jgi:hypothetical protein
MRLTMAIWWSLALVWLLTCRAGGSEPAPNDPPAPEEVKGFGPTHEVAREDALRQAVKRLREHLRRHEPPLLHWQPSEEFVQKQLLEGPGRPGKDDEPIPGIGPSKTWMVTLRFPHDMTLVNWDRQAERQERAEERLSHALHLVSALFLVLLVGVGYVRLDEWTRSRYTAWLRVAGAAVLTLAAAGWWWSH